MSEPTPEAAALLAQAAADYDSDEGYATRIAFDKHLAAQLATRPAAAYDENGVLKDGAKG